MENLINLYITKKKKEMISIKNYLF